MLQGPVGNFVIEGLVDEDALRVPFTNKDLHFGVTNLQRRWNNGPVLWLHAACCLILIHMLRHDEVAGSGVVFEQQTANVVFSSFTSSNWRKQNKNGTSWRNTNMEPAKFRLRSQPHCNSGVWCSFLTGHKSLRGFLRERSIQHRSHGPMCLSGTPWQFIEAVDSTSFELPSMKPCFGPKWQFQ